MGAPLLPVPTVFTFPMHFRFLVCLAACVAFAPLTKAQTLLPELAFTPTGDGERQDFRGSAGLFFTTNAPLTISSLGYWDDNLDGVTASLTVAIYEVSSGTITNNQQAFITFNGTQGALYGPTIANQQNPPGQGMSGRTGQFRMDNLANPFVLGAGSYALVAWGYNAANRIINAPEGGTAVNVNSFGGILTFNDSRYTSQTAVMPTNLDSTAAQYVIATFSPDLVAVPEPGHYALMAGAAGLAGSWWMRRRKTRAAEPVAVA